MYRKNMEHPHKLDLKERTLLDSRGGAEPKDITRPSHMLIVDDCQGSNMYTMCRRDLMHHNHMTIKHRHILLTICYNLGQVSIELLG